MTVGNARDYPSVEHLKAKVLNSRVGAGLTHKHKTRLERLARNKHSWLL